MYLKSLLAIFTTCIQHQAFGVRHALPENPAVICTVCLAVQFEYLQCNLAVTTNAYSLRVVKRIGQTQNIHPFDVAHVQGLKKDIAKNLETWPAQTPPVYANRIPSAFHLGSGSRTDPMALDSWPSPFNNQAEVSAIMLA